MAHVVVLLLAVLSISNALAVVDLLTLDPVAGFSFDGGSSIDHCGMSASVVGDVNSDGYEDIAFSCQGDHNNGTVYVVFYGVQADTDLATIESGCKGFRIFGSRVSSNVLLGCSVSKAGDFNGDGYADIVIGAPNFASDSPNRATGGAFVIYGRDTSADPFADIDLNTFTTGSTGMRILSEGLQDIFGYKVDFAGDVNSDGYADIIIAVPQHQDSGAVYIVFGKRNCTADIALSSWITGLDGFKVVGASGVYLGYSVSGAGDVNGDGYDDVVVVGSDGAGDTSFVGYVFVIYGNSTIQTDITVTTDSSDSTYSRIYGGPSGSFCGASVDSACDFNHDGIDDVVIGCPGNTSMLSAGAGSAYVVFGKAATVLADIDLGRFVEGVDALTIHGASAGGQLGWAVSSAGDVNGDGISDIMVGAPGASPSPHRLRSGMSYVIFGGIYTAPINLSTALTTFSGGFAIMGATAGDGSGTSVGSAGDINRDGYGDVLICSVNACPQSRTQAGKVYVVYGSSQPAAPSAVPTVTLLAPEPAEKDGAPSTSQLLPVGVFVGFGIGAVCALCLLVAIGYLLYLYYSHVLVQKGSEKSKKYGLVVVEAPVVSEADSVHV